MVQADPDFLIIDLAKKDARLHQFLTTLSGRVRNIANYLGVGLDSTVAPPNVTKLHRSTLAEKIQTKQGNQSTLTAASKLDSGSGSAQSTVNLIKRISVRM